MRAAAGRVPRRGVPRSTEPVTVDAGDALILVTDGVTECRSPLGDEFDEQGVLEVARAHPQAPPDHVLRALHERLRHFAAGAPPRDDMTAVVCRLTTA